MKRGSGEKAWQEAESDCNVIRKGRLEENAEPPRITPGPCTGIREKFPGIGSSASSLRTRSTHVSDRDGKTCSGAMAQLGTFEGITREKGRSPSLFFALARLFRASVVPTLLRSHRSLGWYHYFTVGWLPKIRDEGGSGHRQRESLSLFLSVSARSMEFLVPADTRQSLRFAVKSIGYENSRNMCEYVYTSHCRYAVSAAFVHDSRSMR